MKQQIQENEYTNREYYRNVSSKKQEIEKNKETRKTYISSLLSCVKYTYSIV